MEYSILRVSLSFQADGFHIRYGQAAGIRRRYRSLAIRLFIAAVFLHFPFTQDVRVKQRQKV
ncbi:hypothetical protein DW839_11390 [Enterocloster bolteae]|uniref:Uncharacterized protein n=1 Tax=Enterocloster bolteae TaxID=208479 RepID=A0A414AWB0_9FIRM|nr:hypothetical protein DW839_11390 [Enterocloster bolteae]